MCWLSQRQRCIQLVEDANCREAGCNGESTTEGSRKRVFVLTLLFLSFVQGELSQRGWSKVIKGRGTEHSITRERGLEEMRISEAG